MTDSRASGCLASQHKFVTAFAASRFDSNRPQPKGDQFNGATATFHFYRLRGALHGDCHACACRREQASERLGSEGLKLDEESSLGDERVRWETRIEQTRRLLRASDREASLVDQA